MAVDKSNQPPASAGGADSSTVSPQPQGFWRRHRIPLVLAVIAVCIYAGSILWFVTNRGAGA